MRRTALTGLAMLAGGQTAWADASFDCGKAQTAVEKEICKDENYDIGNRDKILAQLYRDLKQEGGHDAVLKGQKAWLKERDACGAKPKCLAQRYDERIAELALAGGDEVKVTGTYAYQLSDAPDSGTAFVARMPNGTLSGWISTVSGPTYHTCDVSFEGAKPSGKGWQWVDAEESSQGDKCSVTFTPGLDSMSIASKDCRDYCGARGFFDETYERVK